MHAANIILNARTEAGLSQRELARRAGTSQSTLNRYERGRVEPSFATVERIVAACGFELRVIFAEPDRHDEQLAELSLQLTPDQRLESVARFNQLLSTVRAP